MDRREEAFAQAVFRGMSKRDAAIEAGYSVGHASNMGWKLSKLDRVQARIAELDGMLRRRNDAEMARVIVPTRDYVLRELIENVQDAKNAKDRGVVNRGLELIGKEIGMFVTRSIQLDSPLARLPAGQLVQLLALIDRALPPADAQPALTAPREVTLEGVAETTDELW